MRIIHISPSYKPSFIYGGPTISIAKLCEVLSKRCMVEVMTTTANGKTELPVSSHSPVIVDGVRVQYFNRITKDHTHFSPHLLWDLYKRLCNSKTKMIIHIHSWWNLVAILSCITAKITNTPVILSPRGMLTSYTFNNRNAIYKLLIHHIIGKFLITTCHVHATSDQEKQDVLKISSPKSINVIPNFITTPPAYSFKPFIPSIALPFKLIFLSRIEEKKGLELLFESLAKCAFPWQLTIAGMGEPTYIEKLKALSQSLKISASLIWAGYITNEEKHKVLSNHNLLVLFSYNENFANVVTESLLSGTPVAISMKVGLSDYIKANDLGWVSEMNQAAITSTLHEAFLDVKKRLRISKSAPSLIKAHFSEEQILNQYLQLYQNLL
ncbi:XrtY-associated glycosyltransferase XYAG1 [Pedobacter sp. B4-66]|uniref:XrtY-associated glycosyltransferase XYAG1 n=1 Tax=Pedobacter sp. B4-66 TaxID=2817280 RepID=UPI001BDA206E|nr:glycosyltransferase [Pedobacter sp. B4-66]